MAGALQASFGLLATAVARGHCRAPTLELGSCYRWHYGTRREYHHPGGYGKAPPPCWGQCNNTIVSGCGWGHECGRGVTM